jgi:hypothetical protein
MAAEELIEDRSLPRPLLCPICKSAVHEFDRARDATGFDCETQGKFKVASAVFKDNRVKNYTPAQWEAALYKERQITKEGEWPVIKSSDF